MRCVMVHNVNDAVRVIQAYTGADVDGFWGNQTSEYFTETLRVLQAELGLTPDGWMGPQTAEAIREAIENGTIDAEFGNAMLALYEGETVDHNGNPVSLSQLHSGRADEMHESNMLQDPVTGKWSVEGGHNAMDMSIIMPAHEEAAEEAPDAMVSAPEQMETPDDDGLSTEFGEAAEDDHYEPAPLPEMSEAELPEPTPQEEEDASGDADAELIDEPTAAEEVTEPAPMPENGPFGFTRHSHGSYMADSYAFTDERYEGLDPTKLHTLYMADVLYDAADRDGNITLAEAVEEYYGQTQFEQSYDELMARAAELGIDAAAEYDVNDPAQMRELLTVLSAVATGTTDPENPPTEFSEALDWLENGYDGLIVNPSNFVAIPDTFNEIQDIGDTLINLSAFTVIPMDPVDLLTGVADILASYSDGNQSEAVIRAYELVNEGVEAIETLPESERAPVILELKEMLEDHKENLERIAERDGIGLGSEEPAAVAAATGHTGQTHDPMALAM